jgi:cytochrome P450
MQDSKMLLLSRMKTTLLAMMADPRRHPYHVRECVNKSWVSHRNPRYFSQPGRFDPERWTPQEKARLPRFSYFPFGGGPRSCIGELFARMEGILLIATIVQRWNMRYEPGHLVVLQPLVTFRPKYRILMKVVKRKK